MDNSVLRKDEIKAIRIDLLRELKERHDFVGGPLTDSKIWAFLDSVEKIISENDSNLKESRANVSWKLIKNVFSINITVYYWLKEYIILNN
jgi:hypothetical protein